MSRLYSYYYYYYYYYRTRICSGFGVFILLLLQYCSSLGELLLLLLRAPSHATGYANGTLLYEYAQLFVRGIAWPCAIGLPGRSCVHQFS